MIFEINWLRFRERGRGSVIKVIVSSEIVIPQRGVMTTVIRMGVDKHTTLGLTKYLTLTYLLSRRNIKKAFLMFI